MSNYAFTGILDKLPHRWPNFTTGEKRLVTVLRYKSLLVTLYFFYPSNFSSNVPSPLFLLLSPLLLFIPLAIVRFPAAAK